MPKVNKKELSSFSSPMPPLELQEEFASFVAQVDKSKFALKQAMSDLDRTMAAILDGEMRADV